MEIIMRQGFPCLFHSFTGLYCPGCGGTRALFALARGDWLLSFQYHPLVIYGVFILTAELVSWQAARITKNPRWYLGHEIFFIYLGLGIVLANWVFKNYMLVVKGIDLLLPLPL